MNNHIKKLTICMIIILLPVILHSQPQDPAGTMFHKDILNNTNDDSDNDEIRYSLKPTKSIVIGIPIGIVAGLLTGSAFSASSYDRLNNAFRGAVIGMHTVPFLFYEISRGTKGISNERNRWAFCLGSNVTYCNYEDAEIQPGLSVGMNRYYYLNKRLDFVYSINYAMHRFKIPDKTIYYSSLTPYKIENSTIEFSAQYIEFLMRFNYKFDIGKIQLNLGIGFFTSQQFLDNTNYRTNWAHGIYDFSTEYEYDYHYNDDEVTGTGPYAGNYFNFGVIISQFIIQIEYKNSFGKAGHIYALSPGTELNTIVFTLGYYKK